MGLRRVPCLSQRSIFNVGCAGASQTSPETTEAPSRQQWQPSARVLALTEEQQQETRERLNIVINDSAGKPVSPIESFDEMVSDASPLLLPLRLTPRYR